MRLESMLTTEGARLDAVLVARDTYRTMMEQIDRQGGRDRIVPSLSTTCPEEARTREGSRRRGRKGENMSVFAS